MSNPYSELLRDPRWQKRRLEIMDRDRWSCAQCGDTESTLNVHHAYYERDLMPWEYPDYAMITLCQPCHSQWHGIMKSVSEATIHYTLEELRTLQWLAQFGRPLCAALGDADGPGLGDVLRYIREKVL